MNFWKDKAPQDTCDHPDRRNRESQGKTSSPTASLQHMPARQDHSQRLLSLSKSLLSGNRDRKIKLGPHHDSPFPTLGVLHCHPTALLDGKPSRSSVSHSTPTQPLACPAGGDKGTEATRPVSLKKYPSSGPFFRQEGHICF